jgi:hypothetical protein
MRTIPPLALLVGLVLSSCGNAGGDGPIDRFVGPYRYLGLVSAVYSPQYHYDFRYWGSVDSDGHGGYEERIRMLDRAEEPNEWSWSGSYALHEDGTLDLAVGRWGPRGGLERLGRAAVLLDEGALDPAFVVLVARVGAFDDGAMSGPYHWAAFANDGVGFALSGSQATFDGAGGWTATAPALTYAGIVAEATPDPDLTYAIAEDGELRIHGVEGQRDLVGGVLPGGDVAVAIGGTDPDQATALYAFVRAGSGLSASSLRESYWVTGFCVQRPPELGHEEYFAFFGTLVADGAGRCYFAGRELRRPGSPGATDPFSADYAVAGDGALEVALDDGGATLVGGVSPDGSFLTLGGGTVDGDDTWFVFGVAR